MNPLVIRFGYEGIRFDNQPLGDSPRFPQSGREPDAIERMLIKRAEIQDLSMAKPHLPVAKLAFTSSETRQEFRIGRIIAESLGDFRSADRESSAAETRRPRSRSG